MNFNEFVNEVKDNIKLFLPRDYENAEVSTMECHKLNRAYTGLMVRKEGEMLTPTINLNQLYEAYKAQPGVTMETVCRKIADIVIEAPIQVDLKAIFNYEDVKDKLFIRVSSAEASPRNCATPAKGRSCNYLSCGSRQESGWIKFHADYK